MLALAIVAVQAGCTASLTCSGNIDVDRVKDDVVTRFADAQNVRIDTSDCDSGGAALVRFDVDGGLPSVKELLDRDPTCRFLEEDGKDLTWRCDAPDTGAIYYTYGTHGTANAAP